ncbi:hypothetical protein [Photobacterium aquimaris]|nr:hypothetical protein [Photobacterium aquimaris]
MCVSIKKVILAITALLVTIVPFRVAATDFLNVNQFVTILNSDVTVSYADGIKDEIKYNHWHMISDSYIVPISSNVQFDYDGALQTTHHLLISSHILNCHQYTLIPHFNVIAVSSNNSACQV